MKRFAFVYLAVAAATSSLLAQEPQREATPQQPPDSGREIRQQPPVTRVKVNEFAMAKRSQKATDLMGKKVISPSNENLGKLEDIVVDANSGRILYGVLSFGGFMGMGDKLFAIPWESLELPEDAKSLVLNVTKDRLKNAEGFDKSHWPNFADETWATKTYKYYDRTPYWETGDRKADEKADAYRDRWYARTTVWQKCSDLCGKDARNMQNEDLGRISDCLVDPDSGRLLYGILAHSGKRYAIPWNALRLSNDGKSFQIDVSKEQLKNAPSFSGESWPNVSDEHWAVEVYRFYHVQPYWTDVVIERRENP